MDILDELASHNEYATHMQRSSSKLEADIEGWQTLLTFYKTALVPAALVGLIPIIGVGIGIMAAFTASAAPQFISGVRTQKVLMYKAMFAYSGLIPASFAGGYIAYFLAVYLLTKFLSGDVTALVLEVWMVFNLLHVFKKQKLAKAAAKATQVALQQINKL